MGASAAGTIATSAGLVGAVVLVDPNGTAVSARVPLAVREHGSTTPSYAAAFDVTPSTLTDGTTYWAMHNPATSGISIHIRRIETQQGYNGGNSTTRSTYRFARYAGAAPTGGTAVPVAKKESNAADSIAVLSTAPAGVTVTGTISEASSFHRFTLTNNPAAFSSQTVDFGTRLAAAIKLLPGEGLVIRATGPITTGSFICGSLGWQERVIT